MRGWLFVALVSCVACGGSRSDESSKQQSVSGSASAACDMVRIDLKGTLPACAAGTSSSRGPGRPFDAVGTPPPPTMSPAEEAAYEAANALSERRNPAAQSPLDRGFGLPSQGSGQ